MPLTKILNQNNPNNVAILGWDVDVTSATDYYAFGMAKPGRTFVASVRISIVMGLTPKSAITKYTARVIEQQLCFGNIILGWVEVGYGAIKKNSERIMLEPPKGVKIK